MLGIINLIYNAITILILARVILSWVGPSAQSNPTMQNISRFVYNATEPLLAPIRNVLPPMAGLDLSPIVLLLGLGLIRQLAVGLVI